MAAVTPLLQTHDLCRSYGGLRAVDAVDFTLHPGEIRAVIGPNGAGKTTLMSLICGRLAPTRGRITFGGQDITRQGSWTRADNGIVYTFQITSVFANLTCYENLALAAQRRLARGFFARLVLDETRVAARVGEALEASGLGADAERPAGELPYGHQRLLEIAMSLLLEPTLLILDEPTQGLAAAEIDGLSRRIRDIAQRTTVLLIEHNMSVVLDLADQITVMDNGAVIAEGSPDQIERNTRVQEVYLSSGSQQNTNNGS